MFYGQNEIEKAPSFGYCASQGVYYYGYKLHAVCGLSGVIHSFDLTKASVHDIHYLKDVKVDYSDCTVIGDRGYISADVQLDLLRPPISDWKFRIEATRKIGNRHWHVSPRQEKSRNSILTAL